MDPKRFYKTPLSRKRRYSEGISPYRKALKVCVFFYVIASHLFAAKVCLRFLAKMLMSEALAALATIGLSIVLVILSESYIKRIYVILALLIWNLLGCAFLTMIIFKKYKNEMWNQIGTTFTILTAPLTPVILAIIFNHLNVFRELMVLLTFDFIVVLIFYIVGILIWFIFDCLGYYELIIIMTSALLFMEIVAFFVFFKKFRKTLLYFNYQYFIAKYALLRTIEKVFRKNLDATENTSDFVEMTGDRLKKVLLMVFPLIGYGYCEIAVERVWEVQNQETIGDNGFLKFKFFFYVYIFAIVSLSVYFLLVKKVFKRKYEDIRNLAVCFVFITLSLIYLGITKLVIGETGFLFETPGYEQAIMINNLNTTTKVNSSIFNMTIPPMKTVRLTWKAETNVKEGSGNTQFRNDEHNVNEVTKLFGQEGKIMVFVVDEKGIQHRGFFPTLKNLNGKALIYLLNSTEEVKLVNEYDIEVSLKKGKLNEVDPSVEYTIKAGNSTSDKKGNETKKSFEPGALYVMDVQGEKIQVFFVIKDTVFSKWFILPPVLFYAISESVGLLFVIKFIRTQFPFLLTGSAFVLFYTCINIPKFILNTAEFIFGKSSYGLSFIVYSLLINISIMILGVFVWYRFRFQELMDSDATKSIKSSIDQNSFADIK